MTIDLTLIIRALILLIAGLMARYLIPWLKGQMDEREYNIFLRMVRIGVYAAQQIFSMAQGKEKKAYVLDYLRANGYDVDDAAVDATIEATVKELKIELGISEEYTTEPEEPVPVCEVEPLKE